MIRPIECPICGKPAPLAVPGQPSRSPFCSERCRQIDLLRWCKGKYAIVEPLSPEDRDIVRKLAEGDELTDEPEG